MFRANSELPHISGIIVALATVISYISDVHAESYSNVAVFVGGAGGVSTGQTLRVLQSGGQAFVTSVSSSSSITHYSGFLAALDSSTRDTDGDGLMDEYDPDNDNDGLDDWTEVTGSAFSPPVPTNPNDPDTDHDGFTDWAEQVAGTSPTDALSVFRILTIDGGAIPDAFVITVPTSYRRRYAIQFCGSFPAGEAGWQPFANQTEGVGVFTELNLSGGTFSFVDDFSLSTSGDTNKQHRFYRVRVTPVP
jgi:hypothetical protein